MKLRRSSFSYLFMSSILVLFCSFALAEHQQQLDFPTEIPNKNQIGSRFFRLDYDLLKDERFRFQVLLPNGWKVIDFRERRVIPNQSPQEIAVFRADPRGGEFGEIMVAVTKVTTDTIPSQWLKNRIKSPEAKIENQQIVPSQSGETWDVLYSFKKNALKLVSRCYAFRIGELLYMIEATSDETVYADRAEFFVTFMALR